MSQPVRTVSVIMPCRNEAMHISGCLDSILENDYPKELLEILIIDGDSEDQTRELILQYNAIHPFIKLLSNPDKITPRALNIGISKAKGEVIIRMDAHSRYSKNYISVLVHHMFSLM